MAGDARIDSAVWINQAIPLAMRRVDVSVTDSAIQNLDVDIVRTKLAARDGDRPKGGSF
jgi:hypothetical protein